MQYVGQTGRALKKRFGEHYRRMNKTKKIDNFLYRHLKRKGHTPANILVQPAEKITYDANSTSRFKIIKRHETELKWIKLLQTPYPLGFNDNIYHEGNLSKMPDFDVFSLLEFRKRTARSHGIKKNGNCKRKSRVQKLANCTLRDLATKLDVHGRHCMLSYLSSLPISVLRSLDTKANKFYDRTNRLYDAVLLTRCYTQHALRPVIDSKLIIYDILSKFLLLIKVWTLLIYRAFSEIYRYNHPYQIISRTVKYQSLVINIINLLGALYLISINLFLILISKLVPLTLELARTLNMFIRLQVMLLRAI